MPLSVTELDVKNVEGVDTFIPRVTSSDNWFKKRSGNTLTRMGDRISTDGVLITSRSHSEGRHLRFRATNDDRIWIWQVMSENESSASAIFKRYKLRKVRPA